MECDTVHSRYTSKAVILGRIFYGNGQKFQDRPTAVMRNPRPHLLGRDVRFKNHTFEFAWDFWNHRIASAIAEDVLSPSTELQWKFRGTRLRSMSCVLSLGRT